MEIIHVYTDGACSKNPGPAGIGVYLKYRYQTKSISKYLGIATNNIAELTSIKEGLLAINNKKAPICLYSDSQYAINILTNPTWIPKKNIELIQEIKKILKEFSNLKFIKVKGHSSNEGNTIADKLAVSAYLEHIL